LSDPRKVTETVDRVFVKARASDPRDQAQGEAESFIIYSKYTSSGEFVNIIPSK